MPINTLSALAESLDQLPRHRNSAIESIATGERNLFENVLNERKEKVRIMQIKEDQIADYGEEWAIQFVRLSSLENRSDTNKTGEKLRRFVWNSLPNSRLKRFQEAFSKPGDFIVPAFNIVKFVDEERVIFDKKVNRESVKGCLTDLEEIPEKLLIDLKILDENPTLDDYERLKRKYDAIPQLKLLFESTASLSIDGKNLRMLSVQLPPSYVAKRYPKALDPDPKVIGTILYSRENELPEADGFDPKKVGRAPRKLVVSHFESVYGAMRKTDKQMRMYLAREAKLLAGLDGDYETLNKSFDLEWKQDAAQEVINNLLSEASALREKYGPLLGSPRQKHKIRAVDQIEKIDALLQANRPGAGMAAMVGVRNAAAARVRDIGKKGGFNAEDALALNHHIKRNQIMFKGTRQRIEKNAFKIGLPLDVYVVPRQSDKRVESSVSNLMRDFRLPDHATNMPLRPFSTFVNAMNQQSGFLAHALRRGSKSDAIAHVIELHVLGKLQAAHTCIEKLKEIISSPRASMATVREYAQRINTIFRAREVFPDQAVLHLEAMYIHVDASISQLHQIVEEAGRDIESDPQTYEAFREHLDTFLDTFKLEELTIELTKKAEIVQDA